MKKTIIFILVILMATVSFSACRKNQKQGDTDTKTGTEISTNTENIENEKEQDVTETEDKNSEKTPVETTIKIVYNGRIDMNFIEVSFDDGEYGIMQLSEEMKKTFDSMTEGSAIEVVYTEKDGQKIVTGIKE